MVLDREAIAARLRRLDECVAELRRLRPPTLRDYAGDRQVQAACERNLQIAIQCALDIGNHIIAEENLRSPEDQGDIFRILGSAAIVSPEFAERTISMAGFSNILVHDYLRIDPGKVYAVLTEGLEDLTQFARYVQAWLDRKG